MSNVEWGEFTSNKVLRRYVERTLHLAIECCLDIGSHIIASERLREPEDNKDIFRVLAEAGVLPPDRLHDLERAAGFRNILVHEYTRVDPAIVFGVLKCRLPDLEAFAQAVASWLDEAE